MSQKFPNVREDLRKFFFCRQFKTRSAFKPLFVVSVTIGKPKQANRTADTKPLGCLRMREGLVSAMSATVSR